MSLFGSLYRQEFHLAKYQGVDMRGVESHGPPAPYPCRSQPSNKLTRAPAGSQVVASEVFFTEVEVAPNDLVWPPGADPADVGASRKPLTVAPQVGLLTGRVDHYEVTL